jgi:hypothetical protein
MKPWICSFAVLWSAVAFVGCGGDAKKTPLPVTGKVTFNDGMPPAAEYMQIRFEPAVGSPDTKTATGTIQKDGTYKLTTVQPNDGAFPGDYKVVFSVYKTYLGREDMITPPATNVSTTPHNATVKRGSQEFNFVLEKKP